MQGQKRKSFKRATNSKKRLREHEDSIEVQQYEKSSSGVSAIVDLYLLPALFVGGVAFYIYKKKQVKANGSVLTTKLRQYQK